MVNQICFSKPVTQFSVLFFQVFRMIIKPHTEVKPLYIFPAFEDIAAVLLFHIIVCTSPESKQIIDHLLQFEKWGRRFPARLKSVQSKLYIGKYCRAQFISEYHCIIIGTLHIGAQRIRIIFIEKI